MADKNPIVNAQAQEELKKRGLRYVIEYNVAAVDITRPEEGTQVRFIEHQAPKDNVRSYAISMANGAKFPAVVVDKDGVLLDGNTRRAAAEKSGTVLNVIRVLDEMSIIEVKLLQMALNNGNGERLSRAETRNVVVQLVESGEPLDTDRLVIASGIAKSTIGNWVKATQFAIRAKRLGINVSGFLEGTRVALSRLNSDEFVRPTVDLIRDANLTGADVTTVVNAVNDAAKTSAEEGHEALERLRTIDFHARIREAASGIKRPSEMIKHNPHLRYLSDQVEVDHVRSVPVADLPNLVEVLDTVVGKLTAMRDLAKSRIAPETGAA